MCELLSVSTAQAAQLSFSLHTLAARGGVRGGTHDGWGVAFYQGLDVALFREPLAAGDSALVRYLETQGPSTDLGISHIRHATRGSVAFANTQPFVRELAGRTHSFAHNGTLHQLDGSRVLELDGYHPVGQTDSEYAFCALMARLHALWAGTEPPSLEARMDLLGSFAADMRSLGTANFLYSDGDALFAHAHRRIHDEAAQAEPPGLWLLERHGVPDASSTTHEHGVAVEPEEHRTLMLASVALTDEDWRPLPEGTLVAVRKGQLLATRPGM